MCEYAASMSDAVDILSIVLIAFGFLELLNVLMLYLSPGTYRGNGVGVFTAYEKSKNDPEVHALVNYLVNMSRRPSSLYWAALGS